MRTPAQRGTAGQWLLESRLARGYDTQTKARAAIKRMTGWSIPQSVYAEWESGRRVPSDANLERLQAFYGAPAAESPALPATADAAVLLRIAEAQERTADVLAQLLDTVRALSEWQERLDGTLYGGLDAVGADIALLGRALGVRPPGNAGASDERRAPGDSSPDRSSNPKGPEGR